MSKWLLLIHQIPARPPYMRMKILKLLQKTGAIALKNSVYVLPENDQTQAAFDKLVSEINSSGGEGYCFAADPLGGISDDDIRKLFIGARQDEYEELASQAENLAAKVENHFSPNPKGDNTELLIARFDKQLKELEAIDYFPSPGQVRAQAAVTHLKKLAYAAPHPTVSRPNAQSLSGRRWTTRIDVHVDRMACAWFIRKFIDHEATFQFIDARIYKPEPEDVRFDMAEAEFTHDVDRCTFEVLADEFTPLDNAAKRIAMMVHDLDFQDSKFGIKDSDGLVSLLEGIRLNYLNDSDRIIHSAHLFDWLYDAYAELGTHKDKKKYEMDHSFSCSSGSCRLSLAYQAICIGICMNHKIMSSVELR